jgi:hypothetical protein
MPPLGRHSEANAKMLLFQNPFGRASWQDGVLEAGQATMYFPIRYISYQYGVDRPLCFSCPIDKRKARPDDGWPFLVSQSLGIRSYGRGYRSCRSRSIGSNRWEHLPELYGDPFRGRPSGMEPAPQLGTFQLMFQDDGRVVPQLICAPVERITVLGDGEDTVEVEDLALLRIGHCLMQGFNLACITGDGDIVGYQVWHGAFQVMRSLGRHRNSVGDGGYVRAQGAVSPS